MMVEWDSILVIAQLTEFGDADSAKRIVNACVVTPMLFPNSLIAYYIYTDQQTPNRSSPHCQAIVDCTVSS